MGATLERLRANVRYPDLDQAHALLAHARPMGADLVSRR
jgi:hypothetical protein